MNCIGYADHLDQALVDVERDVLLRSTDPGATGPSRVQVHDLARSPPMETLDSCRRRPRAPLREVAWDPQPFVEDPAPVLHL